MRVIVFDVNETLLDLAGLDAQFEQLFGDAAVVNVWFTQLLQNALLATVLDAYQDFGELALAALTTVAAQRNIRLKESDRTALVNTMQNLPPHPDVTAGLELLKNAGFRLAALTNSPYRVLEPQLSNAGIKHYLDSALSVDEVRRFKPHRAVYKMAAEKLGITTAAMRMVAAHAWDTSGALAAGCQAAFVARPGKLLGPLDPPPDIQAANLVEVAQDIIRLDTP